VEARVIARVDTPRGELVLRQAQGGVELIGNGIFLMDTSDGRSERLLVEAALQRHDAPHDVLIGGLGVGFSLVAALSDARVRRITVAEIEPALVEWHATHLRPYSCGAVDDPRVRILVDDLAVHLATAATSYDVVCLDVDNGPDWTVTAANSALYGEEGTRLIVNALRPGGLVSVWSAMASAEYEVRLRRHLDDVAALEVPVPRGGPDVVYVGRRPRTS
jgi:spermidine synthase